MRKLIVATLTVTWLGLAGNLYATEQQVPLDKLPKPVAETVKKRFPKAEQLEAVKSTNGNKTVYDVTVKDAGKVIDATVTPEGVLQSYEKEIPVKDLPKQVTTAIEAKFPKSNVDIAAEFFRVSGNKEIFEYFQVVVILSDKRVMAAEVTLDGRVLRTEDKTNMKD